MDKICVGKSDGKNVYFDLEKLWKTRLLILANSGGGKSWILRLLAELICKFMPVILIDPEGEFSSLREKFPFVLIGKDGETPADVRSAKLVMLKILELRASAIFDLSELPIRDRHEYVKIISETAINSPKNLWRPTCFIFDEVHVFCPENGKGESVAKAAVIGFPTQGRKRHFISIFATQRPSKLAMDARAEFLNRMIGMTFEPDDLKVAATILGVSGREETLAFNKQMRTMEEGNFFAFGRAISLETILVKVGMVKTSHGVNDSPSHTFKAPPTPEMVKKLLPQLADLPKQAQESANSEAALRAEVLELKRQLRERPTVPAPVVETKIVQVPVFAPGEVEILTKEMIGGLTNAMQKMNAAASGIGTSVNKALELTKLSTNGHSHAPAPRPTVAPVTHSRKSAPAPSGDETAKIPSGERDLLKAIAQYENATPGTLAMLTGLSTDSVTTYVSRHRKRGFVDDQGQITQAGMDALGNDYEPLPTGVDLQNYWRDRLSGGEAALFSLALDRSGEWIKNSDAEIYFQGAYTAKSITTYLTRLKKKRIIEVANGAYRAAPGLF